MEPLPRAADPSPVLRTLSPALRGLERNLRSWLDGPHRYPLPTMSRYALEGLADDLQRQANALDSERPLLVVMLLGGTGVGKSTLLNALAGGSIAAASFQRPTTRDPVVYYHESVRLDRLAP
ncbi:MAG: GTPase, partial [Gemmataceae bacterium]